VNLPDPAIPSPSPDPSEGPPTDDSCEPTDPHRAYWDSPDDGYWDSYHGVYWDAYVEGYWQCVPVFRMASATLSPADKKNAELVDRLPGRRKRRSNCVWRASSSTLSSPPGPAICWLWSSASGLSTVTLARSPSAAVRPCRHREVSVGSPAVSAQDEGGPK
jgi:hypothetical protein